MSFFARLFGLAGAVFLTSLAFYMSRFWIWQAPWGNDGLFGLKTLSPYGDIIRRGIGGTWLREFDLLIWFCGFVLLLSFLRWISRRLYSGN